MRYLAHTAHKQFLGLLAGCVAWILIMAATGLDEWRRWYVQDASVVSSGVAWVGVWRACFYSHALDRFEVCRHMDMVAGFLPPDIVAARVLMVAAMAGGLAANMAAAYALRMAYFSVRRRRRVRLAFVAAGSLYVATGACSCVPLVWSVTAVLANGSIAFPPEFHMPAVPAEQRVGPAVAVGMAGAALIMICGLTFLCYRSDTGGGGRSVRRTADVPRPDPQTLTTGGDKGKDNPTFDPEEVQRP